MELNYNNMYEYENKKYQELLKKYNNALSNPKYIDAIYNSSFDFLRMSYLYNRLDLYLSFPKESRPVFKFTSVQDAISTYSDLMNFNKKSSELLDKATLINYVSEIKNNINKLVKKSNYLSNALLIDDNSKVEILAMDCLKNIPNIIINDELRNNILVDMVNQFDEKQITGLTKIHLIKSTDIDMLSNRVITKKAKENIKTICAFYNMQIIPIKSVNVRLKGVTFNNDDGSSRQEFLKELKEKVDSGISLSALTLEPFTYKPELGDEEPAIKVLWGEKQLGFLPKDAVLDLQNNYEGKIITARVKNISGGDKVPLGLELTMDICEKAKSKELEEEREM